MFDSNGRVAAESNSNGKFVVIKSPSLVCTSGSKYELFSEYYASNLIRILIPDSWSPLINALNFYGSVVGVPTHITYSIKDGPGRSVAFAQGVLRNISTASINISRNNLLTNKNWFDITYNFIVTINHENFHLNHFIKGIDDDDHGTGISYNHALVIAEGLNHLATDASLKQQKILEKSDVIINELNQIIGYLPKGLDQRNLDAEINDLLKPVGYKLTLLRSIDGDKIVYKKNN